MAKKIDITDKLSFNENPVLVIGTEELEVNADAETMIRLMGVFSNNSDMEAIGKAVDLLFDPEEIKAVCGMKKGGNKLSAKSLAEIVNAAIGLVMGENGQGEQ